jgi:hypothetical protein
MSLFSLIKIEGSEKVSPHFCSKVFIISDVAHASCSSLILLHRAESELNTLSKFWGPPPSTTARLDYY